MKHQIKSVYGDLLFEYECETVKDCLIQAVKSKADLSGANLSRADLYRADLSGADLSGANLSKADLSGADLSGANLSKADLSGANLSRANLYRADLSGANLSRADLSGANLSRADLSGADLYRADLSGANGLTQEVYNRKTHLAQGTIKAWKKVNGHIISLEIPTEAKRIHAISSRKCRAEFAKVLEIKSIKDNSLIESIVNTAYAPHLTYKVGEMVYPDKFDDSFLVECSHGINFFITEIEALEY